MAKSSLPLQFQHPYVALVCGVRSALALPPKISVNLLPSLRSFVGCRDRGPDGAEPVLDQDDIAPRVDLARAGRNDHTESLTVPLGSPEPAVVVQEGVGSGLYVAVETSQPMFQFTHHPRLKFVAVETERRLRLAVDGMS